VSGAGVAAAAVAAAVAAVLMMMLLLLLLLVLVLLLLLTCDYKTQQPYFISAFDGLHSTPDGHRQSLIRCFLWQT